MSLSPQAVNILYDRKAVYFDLDRQNVDVYNYHNLTRLAAILNYMILRCCAHKDVDDVFNRFVDSITNPLAIIDCFLDKFEDFFYLYVRARFPNVQHLCFSSLHKPIVDNSPIHFWVEGGVGFVAYVKPYLKDLLQRTSALCMLHTAINADNNSTTKDRFMHSAEYSAATNMLSANERALQAQMRSFVAKAVSENKSSTAPYLFGVAKDGVVNESCVDNVSPYVTDIVASAVEDQRGTRPTSSFTTLYDGLYETSTTVPKNGTMGLHANLPSGNLHTRVQLHHMRASHGAFVALNEQREQSRTFFGATPGKDNRGITDTDTIHRNISKLFTSPKNFVHLIYLNIINSVLEQSVMQALTSLTKHKLEKPIIEVNLVADSSFFGSGPAENGWPVRKRNNLDGFSNLLTHREFRIITRKVCTPGETIRSKP